MYERIKLLTLQKRNNPRVDLVPIHGSYKQGIPVLLGLDSRIVLEGAHGEEIVRSVFVDQEVRMSVHLSLVVTVEWRMVFAENNLKLFLLEWFHLHGRGRRTDQSVPAEARRRGRRRA
jgi:hypothetical protein